jgi:hypothetical protein
MSNFFWPLTSVLAIDSLREAERRNAGLVAEISLARRYQEHDETFDAAAFCYLTWLKRIILFNIPKGFAEFLKAYSRKSDVNNDLRQALFDAVFVKMCTVWGEANLVFELLKQIDVLETVINHSEIQISVARLIYHHKIIFKHSTSFNMITIFMFNGLLEMSLDQLATQYNALRWGNKEFQDAFFTRFLSLAINWLRENSLLGEHQRKSAETLDLALRATRRFWDNHRELRRQLIATTEAEIGSLATTGIRPIIDDKTARA